jgi:hypothetical protein
VRVKDDVTVAKAEVAVEADENLKEVLNMSPGKSKIKVKSMYKKRMATARRLIIFGVFQGVNC